MGRTRGGLKKKAMKKSDKVNCLVTFNNVFKRTVFSVFSLILFLGVANAQDFMFIEGSVHGFSVAPNPDNIFEWSFHDDAFNLMPANSIDFIEGQFDVDVTVQFIDLDRTTAQLVYLAVTETAPSGCFTTRAISIDLQPNNMYLEFAAAETQDCISIG